ncbi:MAG: FAD-dependent thymidylate synthase [Defluviitoga tunisiensis]|jgi:thymidylate synthase (FAD)|nr:FAD-dependent thymidylate synthase [Defluviitoga tunisiensis]MDY0379761.1 FAD-dependent thymidylate synthase [Defluviitoga tunisiensis]HHV01836.1 FAD-dependent thymidylate synthase [Defluviitoga tunisiensis]HOB55235.1 FAD-dependent thymidylate synthase [Defluviitoga tunisiensis]HOL86360.1 FAD-dependent thymidylate synthase [Defluviitoga tunisiensis]
MKNSENILKVLDKGFVEIVDYMGGDRSAVRAARVSHGKDISTDERDKNLIAYLMKNGHTSPFEHITFTFHVKAPIFVVRQWFRHRIGMSPNEISRRYTSKNVDEFYIPSNIRIQDIEDKQKSVVVEDEGLKKQMIEIIEEAYLKTYESYEKLINLGVAKELARIILPVGEYTEFYLTTNARALMHFLDLRASSHAQWEIQQYAIALAHFFQKICPWTYEAYIKYVYQGDVLEK